MDTDNTVAQADVPTPAPEAVTDKTASDATVTAEVEKPKPPEGYVPHQALHQERIQRRRLERDLAEERMKWETANKRLEEIAKKFAPQEKVPDETEDPVGAITHETRQTREALEALRKEREEEKKQTTAQRQQQAFMQRFDHSARTFASKQPDFVQAQEHLFKDYIAEAQEAGATEEEATQEAWRQWGAIVNRAFEYEQNPAERIYSLAKRRGYKGASNTQEKIETIANGAKATSPLSGASGKAPSRLTAEAIAEMKQEDFDRLSDADFKRIFG
jgi:hypothetical protein